MNEQQVAASLSSLGSSEHFSPWRVGAELLRSDATGLGAPAALLQTAQQILELRRSALQLARQIGQVAGFRWQPVISLQPLQ
jgi:hypothetical protein